VNVVAFRQPCDGCGARRDVRPVTISAVIFGKRAALFGCPAGEKCRDRVSEMKLDDVARPARLLETLGPRHQGHLKSLSGEPAKPAPHHGTPSMISATVMTA